MTRKSQMEALFHPDSIAVVGSMDPENHMNIAHQYVRALVDFGYEGQLYPINPHGGEICGLNIYPSILDVPGPVDFVICCVAASSTPTFVEECVTKGVKAMFFFTAGFSETGEDDGARWEHEILEIARRGDLRIIGPNCMGVYCPESRITFGPDFPKDSGSVGFLCQSGGNTFYVIRAAAARGIRFSQAISYGNASDINECDLLEHFAKNDNTSVIIAYIEGVKQGQRFLRVVKEAANKKPVIILKAGKSEAGGRTAASHTAALAGTSAPWDSLFKQTGAISVSSLEELIDVTLPFIFFPAPQGRRVGIVGVGGGASVLAADACESAGLTVPPFPTEISNELKRLIPVRGNIFTNPIDSQQLWFGAEEYADVLKIVSTWHDIDFLLCHLMLCGGQYHFEYPKSPLDSMLELYLETSREISKPMAVVLHSADGVPACSPFFFKAQQKCIEADLPTYPSFFRAANAINKFFLYYEGLNENGTTH